ncbi:unnamed protein product [Linum tenue]|uniref:Short-chain dehydrogenase TIC 32, chloroplastic n=1 Tax=Linum tenue TaxID=586396 RepID=A0AAV0IZM6_9ROSI|nr:unnamed protein product [Linum tenue]CAI0403259.1 unnamed protein product [Linum tenue]
MWLFKKNGPSGFSSSSTAEQVTSGIDASSLTAIVTGASSGIGAETARVLAVRGVNVVMGVRNMDSGKKVREEIVKQAPSAKVDAMELDLSSLASVRKFASAFNSSGRRLNLLIYSSYLAYGQSKLANILHAKELSRRLKEEGANVTANSLHPGVIATNLFRHMTLISGVIEAVGKLAFKNVEQGAATTCYVALHPQVKGISGEYFSDSNLSKPTSFGQDAALGKKLWDFSMELVK